MSTKVYERKRDFSKTPEPRGRTYGSRNRPAFVVQQHDARTMHFDFRLEVDGVLKSWAVPKGPSMDPKIKRLAVPTEDHPLEYARFEGVIPERQYGAGAVIVWDRGTYENVTGESEGKTVDPLRALRAGHLVFELKGAKLKGRFVLQRAGHGTTRRWFLIKSRDELAANRGEPVSTQRKSVLSGRTVQQVARQESARW
jgi:DNA ligase D-like protein (predicted 3'-phosphoesterase)